MHRPASLAGIAPPSACRAMAAIACCHIAAIFGIGAGLAEEPQADPPAGSAPFAPSDISIGEPLQLPFEQNSAATDALPRQAPSRPSAPVVKSPPLAAPTDAPPARPFAAAPSGPRAASPSATAGTGWLGLTVDDSLVTGRLIVVDVAPQGPAASAGIAPRDALLAINGVPLHTADELAAALAAISPGMDVKMAIGKGDRIDELTVRAVPRPREQAAPSWQAATEATPPVQPEPQTPVAATQPRAFAPPPATAPTPQPDVLPAPALSRATPVQPSAPPIAGPKGRTALGVRTVPVDPAMQARFQLPEQRGAFVIGVVHDLPASKAGVPPGSVIVAIDNQPVRSPDDLTRIVTGGPVGAPLPLQYVLPGGEARRAEVTLQPLDVPLERVLVGESP